MIIIKNLVKKFKKVVINNISTHLRKGEVIGLIGPNGAGKTTLMRIVVGIINPTSGDVNINGMDISNTFEYKKLIGYMPENSALYDDMDVYSYLNFIAQARNIPKKDIKEIIIKTAKEAQVYDVINQKIATLSKGYKRRVSFAQAIIHNPSILILDEPTEGLDPNQKKEFYSIIQAYKKDKLIIISTHVLDEISQCSKVLLINNGEIIIDTDKSLLDIKENETLSDLFYRLTKGKE